MIIRRLFGVNATQSLSETLGNIFLSKSPSDKEQTGSKTELTETNNLSAGGLIKEVPSGLFGKILESGLKSREFVGASSGSDATPFDVDFLRLEGDISIQDLYKSNNSNIYGDITLYIEPNQRITDHPNAGDQFELIKSGIVNDNHYGIRTALPSSFIANQPPT